MWYLNRIVSTYTYNDLRNRFSNSGEGNDDENTRFGQRCMTYQVYRKVPFSVFHISIESHSCIQTKHSLPLKPTRYEQPSYISTCEGSWFCSKGWICKRHFCHNIPQFSEGNTIVHLIKMIIYCICIESLLNSRKLPKHLQTTARGKLNKVCLFFQFTNDWMPGHSGSSD